MARNPTVFPLTDILRDAIVGLVRSDDRDMTARQLAVFLTCYLDEDSTHTVRGLAAALNVSKPAITRALDRLEAEKLARRKPDPADRRSILVAITPAGTAYLRNLRRIMAAAAAEADKDAGVAGERGPASGRKSA